MVAVRHHRPHPLLVLLTTALALSACAGGNAAPESAHGSPASDSGPASVRTPDSPTAPAQPPGFVADIQPVTASDLGRSWHQGCPVGAEQLRQIKMTYWGFDAQAHTGTLVVNHTLAADAVTVFRSLYERRFPIHRMKPVSAYGGDDNVSMANDNTSGFNCRDAVTGGPAKWSAHAYGEAIDVNTVENPYVLDGEVLPAAGRAYADRAPYRPGMAVPDGVLVKAFASVGWSWGGVWSEPDYQHFSSGGH